MSASDEQLDSVLAGFVSDSQERLNAVTALQALYLSNTKVDGELGALSGCSALAQLDLSSTEVGGELASLSGFSEAQSLCSSSMMDVIGLDLPVVASRYSSNVPV